MENYLEIENEALPLPNGGLSLTLINPVFDSESIARAYSFPFNFALSPRLSNLLNHPARLDAKPQFTYLNAKLLIEGQEFFKGKFSIHKGVNRSIEGNLQNESRTLLDNAEKIKLRDLVSDIEIPQLPAEWSYVVQNPTSGKFYRITIDSNNFEYTAGGSDTLQNVISNLLSQINAVYPTLGQGLLTKLYLKDSLNRDIVVSTNLSSMSVEFIINYGEAKRSSFSTYLVNELENPVDGRCWNITENRGLYADKRPDTFNSIINPCYYSTSNEWVVPVNQFVDTNNDWEHTYAPYLYLSDILNKIKIALNISGLTGDFLEFSDFAKILIDHNYVIDEIIAAQIYNTSTSFYEKKYCNVFASIIKLSQCLPDITAKEFILSIAEWSQCFISFENNILTFRKKKDSISKESIDWSFIIEPNQERQFIKQEGFTIKYKTYDSDIAPSSLEYIKGDGVKEILLNIGILSQTIAFNIKRTLKVQEKGNTMNLRIFFDGGTAVHSNGNTYNITCIDDTNSSFSLELGGANGLYKTFREGIDDITADGWEIVKLVNIKASQIFRLQNWAQATVYFFDTEGCAVNAIIKKIEIKISDWAIQTAKVTFVKY